MDRRQVTENYIFRWFRCGLSLEKTCELCDVSQKTVEGWDRGKPIPGHHKKLMAMYSGQELGHHHDKWRGWRIRGPWLITPYGEHLTMEELLYLSIRDSPEIKVERARRGLKRKGA